jgi:hypothetical protein
MLGIHWSVTVVADRVVGCSITNTKGTCYEMWLQKCKKTCPDSSLEAAELICDVITLLSATNANLP